MHDEQFCSINQPIHPPMAKGQGSSKALTVGVFYDGSYFSHVSNYYNYVHPHRRRLHIGGLHDFVKEMIAEREGNKPNLCHIIDAHFFRGRFSAKDANEKPNQLYYDRVFDEVLMHNNVRTHYLPVKDREGVKREKGIDVLMALEIFELAMLKRYDVVVLIASDSDHVPLVRKLHALGCKTMLLGWDFEYKDELSGETQTTKTSIDLWNNVTYALEMTNLVKDGLKDDDEVVQDMFVAAKDPAVDGEVRPYRGEKVAVDLSARHTGKIMSLKSGVGFIEFPNNNVFFHENDLPDDLLHDELNVGDTLEFEIYINGRGQQQARNIERVAVAQQLV